MALEMIDILADEGAALDRVCMGHQGNRDQIRTILVDNPRRVLAWPD
jgi:predicted metal-dependent phosphotriesterase family hydrolase